MITREYSILKYILLLLVCCLSFSCEKEHKNDTNKTVLVYFAANNNLSSRASQNLEDMKIGYVPDYFEPGKSKNGNVLLVYMHQSSGVPKLIRLSKDKYGTINEEVLKEYDNHNSLDDSVMMSVLSYSYQLFPAKENGLILWSHGTGWLPSGYYSKPVKSGAMSMSSMSDEEYHSYDYLVKSFGQETGVEMEIPVLAEALPMRYSYIIFDACLMGGVEVAYEFKNKAEYQIFSAAEILASGFPYNLIMEPLLYSTDKIENRLKEVSSRYFNYYNSMSQESQRSATVALVNSAYMSELAESAKAIFSTGRENTDTLTMSTIQGFFESGKNWYYDLDDYLSRIYTSEGQYSAFATAMGKTVLYSAHTDYFIKGVPRWNYKINKYCGLSTYIPNPDNSYLKDYYRTLSWNKTVQMIQ